MTKFRTALPQAAFQATLVVIAAATTVAPLNAQAAIKESVSYPNGTKSLSITCSDKYSGKPVRCPESVAKKERIDSPVQTAYHESDFAELEAIFSRISSGSARFADGTPELVAYQDVMYMLFNSWQRWDGDLVKLKEWQKAYPDSVAAMFSEALYWNAYAWNARGKAYASQVRSESWDLFHERIAKAHAVLELLRPKAKQLPAWYALKMELSISGASDVDKRALFDEAITFHRNYYPLYLAMARNYEPKWGGSAKQFDDFAKEAVRLAKGYEGRGLYSRIYWTVDSPHGAPFDSEKSRMPDWNSLKAGFTDLMKLHPGSDKNLNRFASFACRSNDSALYRKLRTQIGEYLDESHFRMVTVDVCDLRHKWQPAAKSE